MCIEQPVFISENISFPLLSVESNEKLRDAADIFKSYIEKSIDGFSNNDKEIFAAVLGFIQAALALNEQYYAIGETETIIKPAASPKPLLSKQHEVYASECGKWVSNFTPDYNSAEWHSTKTIAGFFNEIVATNKVLASLSDPCSDEDKIPLPSEIQQKTKWMELRGFFKSIKRHIKAFEMFYIFYSLMFGMWLQSITLITLFPILISEIFHLTALIGEYICSVHIKNENKSDGKPTK